MKKLLITALFTFPFLFSSAQEDIAKNFRFGLMGNTSVGWLSPDDERKFSSAGVGLGLGWGLQMEFKLGKTTSLVTGLNLESFSAKLNFDDADLSSYKSTYYSVNEGDYTEWTDLTTAPDTIIYQLSERKYKINYVNLPFILKMKTKEIGYFTYFGEFGAVLGFEQL